MKTVIQIIKYSSGEVAHQVDVTGKIERQIEKIDRGLNVNLNHNDFYTTEAEIEDQEQTKQS